MNEEIAAFTAALTGATSEMWGPFTAHRGTLAGRAVIVTKSGVGKALAAAHTQHLVDSNRPTAIVFTGLAGALNPAYRIGDIVVARDCLQHDLDATALGFARGAIPFTPWRIFACDEALVYAACVAAEAVVGENAASAGEAGDQAAPAVHTGRILTGDRFITDAAAPELSYLRDELAGDAVEMEGAAVALVATLNDIPCVVIRTVSDRADGTAPGDFTAFLARASEMSRAVVERMCAAGGA